MFKKTNKILVLSLLLLTINNVVSQTKFAVIGDYGKSGSNELNVSLLVKSWNPDFILTLGDNNYEDGEASTIDENIGQYYQEYISPYFGTYGSGSPDSINHFYPTLGNHDWHTPNAQPYLDYFTLPGNERYYDIVIGDVHFFMIDSDNDEPDGNTYSSTQGLWFQNTIANSSAKWKIVCFHHAAYSSSSRHGSTVYMQWPFKELGVNAVLAGHDHVYERLIVDGLVYFVNGLGGKSRYNFGTPLPGSIVRYRDDYGAMLVEVNVDSINFKFINVVNDTIDNYTIIDLIPVELSSFSAFFINNSVRLTWTTETELNNLGFDIERKDKKKNNWKKIKFIQGQGTTTSRTIYEFNDVNIHKNLTYQYRLKQIDFSGTFEYSDVVSVEVGVPNNFFLSQNYPNPFNPSTRIDFTLPEKQLVNLRIYNTLGELVRELINKNIEAGSYSIIFDALNLPSGVYIYRLQTATFTSNKKMTLLR